MFGLVDAFLHLPFCCVDPGLIACCALCGTGTVNSEIFARVLFSRNMRSFVKINSSRIGEITLSLTDIGISRPCHEFSTSQIILFKK